MFDFHIVNFPDLFRNIQTAPAYGTYISQLTRYNRACHNYDNFSSRHSMLADRLFSEGFSARKLGRTFYKFMGRYPELSSKFNESPSSICDSGSIKPYPPSVDEIVKGDGCHAQGRACLFFRTLVVITD